jgi:hypothetical protein
MYPHKCHTPAEVRNGLGEPVGRTAFLFGGFLELLDRVNVSLSQLVNGTSWLKFGVVV